MHALSGVARRAHRVNPGFVCGACCRTRSRPLSSTAPAGPASQPPSSGIVALSSRRLISVSGPDVAKYLQGAITASVANSDAQPRETGFYAAFLGAQGRIMHDVFVYPDVLGIGPASTAEDTTKGTSFLIEVDANEVDRLFKHIKRYKLRAKFNMRVLPPDEASVWHAWDDGRPQLLEPGAQDSKLITRDPRAPGLGYRLVTAGNAAPAPQLDLGQTSEDMYHVRRYLLGVAEGQDEIVREHALPQESNMDYMNGIDWRKGCYVGQELTIRTKHRGIVRKRILPCVIYDPAKPAPETLRYRPAGEADQGVDAVTADMVPQGTSIGRFEKSGRSAGKWLKGIGNVGLGLCRLEIMTDIVLAGETAAAAYNPADEFILQWDGEDVAGQGQMLKVKAFVPDWLRAGLAGDKKSG